MTKPQFSLRAMFVFTAIVSVVLVTFVRAHEAEIVVRLLAWAVPAGALGLVAGSMIGRDDMDSAIGAALGLIGGVLLALAMPEVHT